MAPAVSRSFGRIPSGVVALAAVLMVFVLAGVYRLLGGERSPAVDTRPAYQAARDAGAFPVASPTALPAGWHALSSDFSTTAPGAMLRIRLRAPGGGAVRLIESAGPASTLAQAELGGSAHDQGSATIKGRQWQRYAASGGTRALTLAEPGRSLVIVGTARDGELRDLAESL